MQSNLKNNTKYSNAKRRSITWSTILVASISITFSFWGTANAGLLSLMASIMGGEQVSAKESQMSHVANSQNMPILAAAVNRDPNPSMDIVPVDDGQALVADLALTNVGGGDNSNNQISTYIVRQGDTVSGVAKMFGVTINTVLWANNLTSRSVLQAGQTLVILPISGLNYTIQKGDTIQGIAKKYNADTNEIMAYNDLSVRSALSVGQSIIIPDAELSVVQQQASGPRKITKAPNEPLLDGWNWPALPGYFMRPVAGGTKTQNLHGHNAIDIAAPKGTPLLASAAGTVIINRINGGWNGGYGNYVVISHPNGTQTLYAHMSRSSVSAGQSVNKGDVIGAIGSTGLSTGPHVHFEIRGAQNPF